MRILQVSHMDSGGGAATSARYLFKKYQELGHESYFAVGQKRQNDPGCELIPNLDSKPRWQQKCEQWGETFAPWVTRVKGGWRVDHAMRQSMLLLGAPKAWLRQELGHEPYDFPGTWKLLDLFDSKPDIIHCHNLHGRYFDLRALPWLSKQAPVILNLRDTWLLSGHCAYFLDCDRWKTGCGQCPDLNRAPVIKRDASDYNWKLKQQIYQNSRLYLAYNSKWTQEQAHASMLEGAMETVIYNSIDTDVFKPGDRDVARETLGIPADEKVILFVANFTKSNPWKDYETMRQAIQQVAQHYHQSPVRFYCIGEAADPVTLSQQSTLHFLSYQEHEVLAQYYQASDVYIHAANAESFGRTVSEALACGCPAVATAVGGISEIIEEGLTGFLTPAVDPQAMANRVLQLLEDPNLQQQMASKAATSMVRQFSLDTQADAFLSWYEEVIEDWKTHMT